MDTCVHVRVCTDTDIRRHVYIASSKVTESGKLGHQEGEEASKATGQNKPALY